MSKLAEVLSETEFQKREDELGTVYSLNLRILTRDEYNDMMKHMQEMESIVAIVEAEHERKRRRRSAMLQNLTGGE